MSTDDDDREGQRKDPLTAPKMADELYLAFPNSPIAIGMNPMDGLPALKPPHAVELAETRPYDVKTFVCAADRSAFVRDGRRFEPGDVEAQPGGGYQLRLRAHRLLPLSTRCWLWLRRGRYAVEPIRPACAHYARQFVDIPDDPEHRLLIRLCQARVDSDGDFLSLTDQRVHHCELRRPVLAEDVAAMDAIDDKLIRERERREEQQAEFDVDAALKADGSPETAIDDVFTDRL